MKIGTVHKLRTWTERQRREVEKKIRLEPNSELNLYRKRLTGQIEAFDRVLHRIDALLRFHHDKWHDRRKRTA